jgi:hypothetical protein
MASPRRTPAYSNVWHNDLMSGVSTVAEPIISGVANVAESGMFGASTDAGPVISGAVSVIATTRS